MTATTKRKVEIFTAGCPACEEAVSLVKSLACDSCDVEVLDMKQPDIAQRAERYGIRSVPAVVVGGKLARCCSRPAIDAEALRAEGLGQPARASLGI
ncbi:glutaredoxin family protein [Tautonia sociabilis]|uniref:Glutaredoxin n=1 Tax=Tautonia sociabilis TaxID=2080755 RepID=A0A432MKZ2_9BACT|nr:thioredoxin family protein [Tautonia sociabilis]RUL87940.1 glutaredoxin [Tautonia sociabilis]